MPPALKASEAQFLFEVAGAELSVVDFTVNERLSSPYEVHLTFASEDEIGFDDVIGKEGLLTLLGDSDDRHVHGVLNEFTHSGMSGRFYLYQARMGPSLWLLSLEQDCRIFQEENVKDIVSKILNEGGIPSDRFEFRLQGQYDPKEYCVQYRETDLHFISRLCEEEGIFYFFEHAKDKHLLVFGDSTVNYQPIKGDADVRFHPPDAMVPSEEVVSQVLFSRQIRTGKMTLKDFNFEKPSLDLTSEKQGDSFQRLEVYDCPAEYCDQTRGQRLADIRLQEVMQFKDRAEGRGTCCRFLPGFTFKLTEHTTDAFNKEYLLVEIYHSGSQPQALQEQAGQARSSYTNQFLAVPSSVTVRSERRTPKPVVEGVQTAIVVGPGGEEIYTDKHGRVKVQFHWDRLGKRDQKSSCWIRVSQAWAGAGWGAMFIPRIDQEVLVDFIEGDPDRPIITGRVYHGTNNPPYPLPDQKTKSVIMSNSSLGGGGFNELRFEDKKGQEEIFLHGQKDWTIAILNDKNQNVGNNETLSVGSNRTKIVGADQSETVGQNKMIQVGMNHTESIGANLSLTVGNNKIETVAVNTAETIGAAKELTIGGVYQVTVGGVMNETVGGAKTEEVGAAKGVIVGASMTETVARDRSVTVGRDFSMDVDKDSSLTTKKLTVEAKDEITFKTGEAMLTMKKNGDISISGKKIVIKGSGDIVIKGRKITQN